jgi:HNH endonuclease
MLATCRESIWEKMNTSIPAHRVTGRQTKGTGPTVGLELAHFDHNPANNDRDNLAWLCRHHHWMFDIGLFSIKAVKLQRDYWQVTKGKRTNVCMKDEGRKAALTRAQRGFGREMALKAVATRRARARAASQIAAGNDEGQ